MTFGLFRYAVWCYGILVACFQVKLRGGSVQQPLVETLALFGQPIKTKAMTMCGLAPNYPCLDKDSVDNWDHFHLASWPITASLKISFPKMAIILAADYPGVDYDCEKLGLNSASQQISDVNYNNSDDALSNMARFQALVKKHINVKGIFLEAIAH